MTDAPSTLGDPFRAQLTDPPRAKPFIVTVYGDLVEPRGGSLWMGSLIEICAAQGISESLVRTAVSRLVASGHLQGDRVGRRSYYRLTDAARAEFTHAARLFYGPVQQADGWRVALDRDGSPGPGWVSFAARQYIAPDLPEIDDAGAPDGVALSGPFSGDSHALVAQLWPLGEVAAGYRAFIDRCRPIASRGASADSLSAEDGLSVRLSLVNQFRLSVLADPRLPAEGLPVNWPAAEARRVFSQAYAALTPAAERRISLCEGAEGPLPSSTPETERRLRYVQLAAGT